MVPVSFIRRRILSDVSGDSWYYRGFFFTVRRRYLSMELAEELLEEVTQRASGMHCNRCDKNQFGQIRESDPKGRKRRFHYSPDRGGPICGTCLRNTT
jgi:hypothetical protein